MNSTGAVIFEFNRSTSEGLIGFQLRTLSTARRRHRTGLLARTWRLRDRGAEHGTGVEETTDYINLDGIGADTSLEDLRARQVNCPTAELPRKTSCGSPRLPVTKCGSGERYVGRFAALGINTFFQVIVRHRRERVDCRPLPFRRQRCADNQLERAQFIDRPLNSLKGRQSISSDQPGPQCTAASAEKAMARPRGFRDTDGTAANRSRGASTKRPSNC